MDDYYKILGLEPDASKEEVKGAYRDLVKQHHPDKGGDPEKFRKINKAYRGITRTDTESRAVLSRDAKPKEITGPQTKTVAKNSLLSKLQTGLSLAGELKGKTTGKENMPSIFSPEGYLIMVWAIFLDLIGIVIFILEFVGVGIPLSWLFDVMGILTIGIWSWSKTGNMQVTKRTARFFKKPGLAFFGEVIPFVGVLPFWSLYVFIDLKKGFSSYEETEIEYEPFEEETAYI